jgi:EAL domain-containing protein (putative c-di-GMP-specific phosphodiesterase class I)
MAVEEDDVYNPAYERFVAFMFEAADLLVEADGRGQISFLGGVTKRLEPEGPGVLIGRPFVELFSAEDRAMAAARLERMRERGGMMPAILHLKQDSAPAIMFGGCALPNGHVAFFLSVARDESEKRGLPGSTAGAVAGLQSPIAFAATVRERFQGPEAGERRLTLVALDGLSPPLQETLIDLEQALFAPLPMDRRLGGKIVAVGRIANARYGILHDGPLDAGGLRRHARKLALQFAPDAAELRLTSTAIRLRPGGLRSDIVATAAVYVMARLAGGSDPSLDRLRRTNLAQLMVETTSRIAALRRMLEDANFELARQPIVSFATGEIHHDEALIRFGDGGSPNEWIALAEAADIVPELDLAVCRQALRGLSQTSREAPPLAINLSGRSLENASFVAELHALLDRHPDAARGLMFELTESAVVREIETVDRAVQSLRHRGFKVCLDDFGAVATSIHYLRSIKVDYVKVDGLFARSSLRNANDRSILRHVIGLARGTGAGVIIEMIETAEQAAVFRALGAEYAQGYFFGAPATA